VDHLEPSVLGQVCLLTPSFAFLVKDSAHPKFWEDCAWLSLSQLPPLFLSLAVEGCEGSGGLWGLSL
jgi:hypothetical protein